MAQKVLEVPFFLINLFLIKKMCSRLDDVDDSVPRFFISSNSYLDFTSFQKLIKSHSYYIMLHDTVLYFIILYYIILYYIILYYIMYLTLGKDTGQLWKNIRQAVREVGY